MSFDADAFMNSVTTDVNATSLPPCPEGEYTGTITDVKVSDGIVKKAGPNQGNPWYRLDFMVETFDANALANLEGRSSRKIKAGIMLDLTASGGLATGPDRNIRLGQLRAAAGLNVPGQPFSFNMLSGRSVKFFVKNTTDNDDPTIVRSEAVGFKAP
jgi:hypothetical protein